jgi:hypothetical protein
MKTKRPLAVKQYEALYRGTSINPGDRTLANMVWSRPIAKTDDTPPPAIIEKPKGEPGSPSGEPGPSRSGICCGKSQLEEALRRLVG